MNLDICLLTVADIPDHSVEPHTATEQSFEVAKKMPFQTNDQKRNIAALYKLGKKVVHSESAIFFLNTSLDRNFIPQIFKINKHLPGNPKLIQEK